MATTRLARAAALPAPAVLPGDVRLMNAVASTVYVLAAMALAALALAWLARTPWFAIRAIQLEGEMTRNSAETIRASAAPRLAGNFFSVDLGKTREAFEGVPWVRRAVVRRVWPDRLVVTIEEHRVAALWNGEERDDRLVNTHGEVFSADVGDIADEALPSFGGPEGSAAQLLSMYRRLTPLMRRLQVEIEQLHQSSRGSWRVLLDTGAVLELGRGSDDEVAARCDRFVRTIAQVTGRYRQPLEYADLRHADGYAVRLRGVTTTLLNPTKP
jgi:cell division protein FtsQ